MTSSFGSTPKEPLKLAFATSEYVTESNFAGGLANYLYRVCQGVRELGHEPIVVVASDTDGIIEHDRVMVHRVSAHRRGWRAAVRRRLKRKRVQPPADWLLQSHALSCTLRRIHRHTPLDLIQYASYMGIGFFRLPDVVAIGRLSSLQHLWERAEGVRDDRGRAILHRIERRALRRMDAVFGPSDLINSQAAAWVGRPVATIESPFVPWRGRCDRSVFAEFLDGKRYVLFFGLVSRLKGADRLAALVHALLSRHPDVHLAVVGKNIGEGEERIVKDILTAAAEYAPRVVWLKGLRRAEIDPIIAHAEAVVLPSRIDNLPNACIEAMAAWPLAELL